jgi:hypothetical protein
MHYTTVTVGLVEGHETEGINGAIAQGLNELSQEVNGPIELVNVVPVPMPDGKLCFIIMARQYEPPMPVVAAQAVINDVLLRESFRKQ